MNRLILIRHAKSDWGDPRLDDHDRPLNARGRAAAALVGDWLASRGYFPDAALVSTATRAAETWERVAARLPGPVPASCLADLYHAPPAVMLKALQGATGGCVAMVGHNPGIAEFAGVLAVTPPLHPRFGPYPTAATTVYEFAAPWAEMCAGAGNVVDFVVPDDLEG